MALATTLKIYMRQLQWQFHEARMTRVWNEIARLLNEEDDGVLVAFSANTYYGDLIFATNFGAAAWVPALPDVSEGRDGTGTIYPDKKYPNNGIGFTALS
jgi:hypothetical protein